MQDQSGPLVMCLPQVLQVEAQKRMGKPIRMIKDTESDGNLDLTVMKLGTWA